MVETGRSEVSFAGLDGFPKRLAVHFLDWLIDEDTLPDSAGALIMFAMRTEDELSSPSSTSWS